MAESPMAERFTLFPSLPPEIQTLIWDLAVRPIPAARQVQYFIIVDHYNSPTNPGYPIKGDFLRLGAEGRINSGYKLAVPRQDALAGGNNSAYLDDASLWVACRASQAAMLRYYNKNEWWSDVHGEAAVHTPCLCLSPSALTRPGDFGRQPGTSHSASYMTGDGRAHYLTFRPAEDLIYLTPLLLDQVDWWHHYAGESVPLLDQCVGQGDPAKRRSFLGFDLAITFDPMMMVCLRGQVRNQCSHTWSGESEMSIVDFVDLIHERTHRTLWFVDYRLRYRGGPYLAVEHAEAETRGIEKFYSQDRVFVEVRRDQLHKWWVDGGDDAADSDDDAGRETPFALFDLLHELYDGRLEVENSPRMRVLACEPQPGKAMTEWPRPAVNDVCAACKAAIEAEKAHRRPGRDKDAGVREIQEDDIDWDTFSLFD